VYPGVTTVATVAINIGCWGVVVVVEKEKKERKKRNYETASALRP
jgi:hypothetical protein